MDRATVLAFMRKHQVAVEASVSVDGHPQAAAVGFAVTDDFEIVFDTLASTRKAQNLRANPHVAFVIGGPEPGAAVTVQLEGIADEPAGETLERLKAAYYEVYPDGPDRLGWPGLIYIRVRPHWVRYSDYTVDPPLIAELRGRELLDR